MESKCNETSRRFFMDQKTNSGPKKLLGAPRGGHNPPGRDWEPGRSQVGSLHLGGLPHPLFAL